MKRLILAMVLAVSGVAFANPEEGEHHGAAAVEEHPAEGHEGGHGKLSVPDFIFHHVTDGFEYEFEIPMNDGENPHIVFPRWRVAMPWGARACAPVTEHTRGDVGEFTNGCPELPDGSECWFSSRNL